MFGIITGLGPRATVQFYSSLMNKITRRTSGRLPRLVLYNVAMSPAIENAFLQGSVEEQAIPRQQVRALLNEAVEHFLANQVKTVAMACNTLQDELTHLCATSGLTNLNMISATVNAIRARNAKRVLILGTASTYHDDLYGRRLAQQGIQCIYPNSAQQNFIETYIRHALDRSIEDSAKPLFADNVRKLAATTKADSVVLACTDLTGDLEEETCGLMVFDSLQLLAQISAEHIANRQELFV